MFTWTDRKISACALRLQLITIDEHSSGTPRWQPGMYPLYGDISLQKASYFMMYNGSIIITIILFQYFLAMLDPQTSSQSHPEPLLFTTLLKETSEVAFMWEDIGRKLGLSAACLSTIKQKYPSDCIRCFIEMLQEWMKQVDPPLSWIWPSIINTIEMFPSCHSLALTLRHKYLPDEYHSPIAKAYYDGPVNVVVEHGGKYTNYKI